MKMNKFSKFIVPALALGMGVALVGSVSSTLAWYQYSTKAQAAYIGTSVGNSENLEIKVKDGQNFKWTTNAISTDVDNLITAGFGTNIIPVTPAVAAASPNLANDVALPADGFYSGIETGVAGYGDPAHMASDANVVQFKLNIRYKKSSSTDSYVAKKLNLVDLTIVDEAGPVDTNTNKPTTKDLYKAVRVHFSAGATNKLFARDDTAKVEPNENNDARANVVTNTNGQLDTDNSGSVDKALVYEWEDEGEAITYGFGQQTAINAAYGDLKEQIGVLPSSDSSDANYNADAENGLELTVTIWIEGWQKLSGIPAGNADDDTTSTTDTSAMWDPAVYSNKKFKVGMRFAAEDL